MNPSTTPCQGARGLILSESAVQPIREWFDAYVCGFKHPDADCLENVRLKATHGRRVQDEIVHLCTALDQPEHRPLAAVIGLLHDVGRFEQYLRFRTFCDRRSVDHAALGIDILRREQVLEGLPERAQRMVVQAIELHNRRTVPPGLSPESSFFARLIRDADKLDIWRICLDEEARSDGRRNEAIGIELPDNAGYSDDVIAALAARRPVNSQDLRNLNDFRLFQMSWVFDLNFRPTYQQVAAREIPRRIAVSLPRNERLDCIFDHVNRHVQHLAEGIRERTS